MVRGMGIFAVSIVLVLGSVSLLFPSSLKTIITPLGNRVSLEQKQKYLPTAPTLSQIFSDNHAWTATLSAERKRVVIATGDVIPARVVNIQATKYNNFHWPFEKVADTLKTADITFINLETPLINDCPLTNEGFTFCGDAKNVEGLTFAGVDVASIANNHAGNYGPDGTGETMSALGRAGIAVTGHDGPVYKTLRGVTFAFLGYNDIGSSPDGISGADETKIQYEVSLARNQADVVIVTYHWGIEYVSQPDGRQRQLGHLAIDAGADLVIGNHPHWIQPVELYNGKLITYAHGNFVFDQEWSLETKQGVVGRYTFYDTQLVDVEFLPVLIENYGQPHFLMGAEKQFILDHMYSESQILEKQPVVYLSS
jgi:poly-gamma-glutamate synthesis protein (capsule biosynthesis protein)